MKAIRKLLKSHTYEIKNGEHLEQVKDYLFKKHDEEPLWGYDDTYSEDEPVSSGYLHYEQGYFLSKSTFNKPVSAGIEI